MKTCDQTRFFVFENYEVHLSFSNRIFLIDTAKQKVKFPSAVGEAYVDYHSWREIPAPVQKVVQNFFKRKSQLRASGGSNPFLDAELEGIVHYVSNWEDYRERRRV